MKSPRETFGLYERVRVSASTPTECWIYTFKPEQYRLAMRRLMEDKKKGRIPTEAADGIAALMVKPVYVDE